MNIMLIFLGDRGGLPLELYEMARGFAKNDCKVYAILNENICNRDEWDSSALIKKVYYVKNLNVQNTAKKILNIIKFTISSKEHRKIKNEFKDINFEFILKYWRHLCIDMISKQINKKHEFSFFHNPIPHSDAKQREIFLTDRWIRSSKKVIVLSKLFIPVVNKCFNIPVNNIYYLPVGIHNYMHKQNSTKKVVYSDDKVNFLFFGLIRSYKGLNILADAYEKVYEICEKVSLTVVGDGDFSEYVDRYSKLKNFRLFNNHIPDNEIGNYFSGSNLITILPYLDATQSGVIPVAMEYSSPIIASDTGGLKEQLDDGKIGLLFESGSVKDLIEKMLYVVNNPVWRIEQIKLMQEHMYKFDYEHITKEFIKCFNERSLKC